MKHIRPYVIPTAGNFAVRFTDPTGRVRALSCAKEEKNAQTIADWIGRILESRQAGNRPPPGMTEWLSKLPPVFVQKLAALGVLDGCELASTGAIGEHFEGWADSIRPHKPDRAEYVLKVLQAFAKRAKIAKLSEITLPLADRVFGQMVTEGKAPNTVRKHQQVLKQFCGWAVRQGLLPANPVAEMQGVSGGVERERKALDVEEQRYLLDYTARAADQVWHSRNGAERCRVSGEERALLYRLAIGTGLRSNEIRSLTRASFQLARVVKGRTAPCVRLKAGSAKNRKEAIQPIQAGLAAVLARHLSRKLPNASAFTLPLKDEVVGMVRADLRGARAEWIDAARSPEERKEREESEFLREVANDEAVFDFHALRVTFITNMARAGVPLSQAVKLARHSDPKLTIGIYTKAGALDLEDAMDSLPEFDAVTSSQTAAAV